MKALILTTAIAIGFAAPSFANDQLARSLGVEPGAYSTAQLIALQAAQEDDSFDFANHIRSGGGSVSGVSAAAVEFARIQAEQDDDGPVGRFLNRGGNEVISTQSFGGEVTDAGRAFAIQQAEQDDERYLARTLESGRSLNGVRSLF